MLTPEQMMAAQKANMETLLGLTHKAFEGVERLVELNMQLARAAMTDSADTAMAVLTAKDAQQLLALQAKLLQPAAEKAAAYNRSVYEIVQSNQVEWVKMAEAQMSAAQKNIDAMIDTATKSAPAGTDSAVALVKSAVSAANNAFESVHKAAKQAAEIAEENLQAMTGTAAEATKASSKPAAKGGRRSE